MPGTPSTNMGLSLWDSLDDYFSHTELKENFEAIDAHTHVAGEGLQIPTGGIANSAVTTAKIADDAVTSDKIAAGAVTSATGADGLAVGSFSVYRNAAQSPSTGSVVNFDAEEWDVSSWYDTTTFRFTPQIAGYYRLSALVTHSGGAVTIGWQAYLLKNGSLFKWGTTALGSASTLMASGVSTLVSANGTTDYFQVGIAFTGGGTQPLDPDDDATFFQGELVGRS